MESHKYHIPVLAEQVLQLANETQHTNSFVDGTFGRGGHTKLLIDQCDFKKIHVFDKDPEAIAYAEKIKESLPQNIDFNIHHHSFKDLDTCLGTNKTDVFLLDLGVASTQLDQAERGFSFNQPGPLDMRMDNSKGSTAAQLIAQSNEIELANIIYTYGEEIQSRKISKAINSAKRQSPINDTITLANIVESVVPRSGKNHPATKTFQALRIAVNRELEDIESLLENVLDNLNPMGRLLIISFHSLEDRIVKQKFKKWEKSDLGLNLTKKCITADQSEIKLNKRSRSAKLRCFEKAS